jgi:hypothetical protein
MEFYPVNKLLLVEVEPEKVTEQKMFYVPETVKVKRYVIATLKRVSDGSQFANYVGKKMVVITAMLETITHENQQFTILPENGVQGFLQESDF